MRIERFIGHGAHIHVSMGERYMKFRDRHRALQWVEATFRSEFDPATQELVFAEGATRRWFYGEGD